MAKKGIKVKYPVLDIGGGDGDFGGLVYLEFR